MTCGGITRTIEIDGREVPFRASAAIPRYYRLKFRRDIFVDLQALNDRMQAAQDGGAEGVRISTLDIGTLEMFENIAYIMARYADPDIPGTPEEWLDGFSTFSIYQILPRLLELWGLNVESQVESKKKLDALTAG